MTSKLGRPGKGPSANLTLKLPIHWTIFFYNDLIAKISLNCYYLVLDFWLIFPLIFERCYFFLCKKRQYFAHCYDVFRVRFLHLKAKLKCAFTLVFFSRLVQFLWLGCENLTDLSFVFEEWGKDLTEVLWLMLASGGVQKV